MWARWTLRVLVAAVLVAAQLSAAYGTPTRTISVPITLARTLSLSTPGTVGLDLHATHIAFTWRGESASRIRFRVTSSDGSTSEWQQVPEVHGPAGARHQHFSAVIAVPHAVAVEWRKEKGVGRVILDYLNTLDGPRREVEIPQVAEADAGDPDIVTRRQWGADESLKSKSGGCERRFFNLQQIFVHHTAGANYDQHPRATMRAIYWYHVARQGWCDIGYNFVIGPDGTIFEGRWARGYRPWETHDSESTGGNVVAGAHVANYNSGSLGISLMGNYSQVDIAPAARESLVRLLAWETDRHDLDPQGRHTYRNPDSGSTRKLHYISGHRDAGDTECPGRNVYSELPSIRSETVLAQGSDRDSAFMRLAPVDRRARYGEAATFTGTLLDEVDTPLPARSISSYYRIAGDRWRRGPETVSDGEGNFTFEIPSERNVQAIATFEGDAYYWGAQSPIARVLVGPEVTIEAEDGTVDAAGVSHHSGDEVVLSGSVIPFHTKNSVTLRMSRLDDDGTYVFLEERVVELDDDSSYETAWMVPDEDGGSYRAVAIFTGDADHAPSRSAPIFLVVDR